ncbi:MAG: hypothetical protein GY800_06735 [Planctomycetes bacterium]|nr:hypothetical protein [Planctomycetota bacterium]
MAWWVFDLEANGLLDTATVVHCGVFRNLDTGEVRTFSPDDEYYLHYMLKFMDSCEGLIGHNIFGYDFPLLKKLYDYEYNGGKIDTLVWSKMLQPKRPVPYNCPVKNKPHSVETWGYRVGRGKPEHNDWSQYSKEMLHRCSEDTAIQTLIYTALLEEMEGYDWQFASWLNNRLFDILGRQEVYGWKVDKEWMDYIIHMTTRWIARIDTVLRPRLPLVLEVQEDKVKGEYKYVKAPFKLNGEYNANMIKWLDKVGWEPDTRPVGGPFTRLEYRPLDPSSRMEAISFLLEVGWVPKEWNKNKKTGERTSPKFSKDDPFEGVEGREGKLLAKRVQIRHRQSSVNGLKKLIRPDGRIAGRVASLAETGRMTHAGIVNIPGVDAFLGKWMRKIFIADEGHTLVSVDSASCQDRMLAARVNNDEFTHTLLYGNKKDKSTIHFINQRHLAAAGYDVTYTRAKSLNFAFKFGASNNKLGTLVNGSPDDGEKARQALLKAAPGLGDLIDKLSKEWRSHAKQRPNKWGKAEYYDGWIAGLDGRPIFIDSEHKLLVYMLQSDEAIMMSYAYVLMYDWMEAEGFVWGKDWGYVCFYHDEYTIECPPENAERIKQLGEAAIVAAGEFFKLACPHVGDGEIGQNWKEVH